MIQEGALATGVFIQPQLRSSDNFERRFVSELFILLRDWMDLKHCSTVFAAHIQNIAFFFPPSTTSQKMTSTCKDDSLRGGKKAQKAIKNRHQLHWNRAFVADHYTPMNPA